MGVVGDIRQKDQVKVVDPIWDTMLHEARSAAASDPILAAFL